MSFPIIHEDGEEWDGAAVTSLEARAAAYVQAQLAGQLAFSNWQGPWSSTTTYSLGASVIYLGLGYVSNTSNNLHNNPSTDSGINWTLIPVGSSVVLNATPSQSTTISGATVNTGQIFQSDTSWNPLGTSGGGGTSIQFIDTPGLYAGLASGSIYNLNGLASNIFKVVGYVTNTGTTPAIAGGFFSYGHQVWGLNFGGAAMGNDSVVIGAEIDVGAAPSHASSATVLSSNLSQIVDITVDRPGSSFQVGNTITGGTIPAGTTITAVDNPIAPTYINLSQPCTAASSGSGLASNSIGQAVYGLVIVGEYGNIGGPGNSNAGSAIQVQANTLSAFKNGLTFVGGTNQCVASSGIVFLDTAMTQALLVDNGTYTQVMSFGGGMTATYGFLASGGTYGSDFIHLAGSVAYSALGIVGGTYSYGISITSATIGYGLFENASSYTHDVIHLTPASAGGSGIYIGGTMTDDAITINGAMRYGLNVSPSTATYGLVVAGTATFTDVILLEPGGTVSGSALAVTGTYTGHVIDISGATSTGVALKLGAGQQIQLGSHATGAGSAALGANCPAVTTTAPYEWIEATASDGSQVYIPAWK